MREPRTRSTLIGMLGSAVLAAAAIVLVAGGCQDESAFGGERAEEEPLRVALTKHGDSYRCPDGTWVRIPTDEEVKAAALRLLPELRKRLAGLYGPEGTSFAAYRMRMTRYEAVIVTEEQIRTTLLDLAEIAERRGEPLPEELLSYGAPIS